MKMNQMTDTILEDAAQAFAALGSEQRLLVLRALVRAGPQGLSIGELGATIGITGATLTHHVKFLTQAGLLTQTRQGRSVICAAVAYDTVRRLADFLLSECCSDATTCTHDHKDKP
ncbi:MAG: helix-turn-helix transcriptional regulator [Rhodobacteraceae bacterium]|nr:helix-turn-helix transcriptional regulator [Paracoccaceae bacterium]